MQNIDISQLKQKLLKARAELEGLEQAYKNSSDAVELDQCVVGRLSRMDAMQAQQMSLETDQRRQKQLIKIDSALRRIESGDYGDCFVCGEEIDARRLAAEPTNTRCMQCADK
ncbi:MAG: TraR/DksA C4-type zinc finger protein [Gammaproteobacteria bacterium]|nr:TraR/DksA C4-type zinc finger protein [Gammaproteobacteria bacterium]